MSAPALASPPDPLLGPLKIAFGPCVVGYLVLTILDCTEIVVNFEGMPDRTFRRVGQRPWREPKKRRTNGEVQDISTDILDPVLKDLGA